MKFYGFLEDTDIIKATDECRDTKIVSGWGDCPLNREAVESWLPVKDKMPGWIGSKFADCNKRGFSLNVEIRRAVDIKPYVAPPNPRKRKHK